VPFTTLIAPGELRPHIDDPDWAVVDCRFTLGQPERGRWAYAAAHIPGAVYAHLEEDLSGTIVPGRTGRHPLPPIGPFAAWLSAWGIDERVQVVTYDDVGGAIAARLWWMLRWVGHDAVAVLDGGWPAWEAAEFPVAAAPASRSPRRFSPRPRHDLAVDVHVVERARRDPGWRLADARAAPRFRGEDETIDPVAGHIPGALPVPFADNLDPSGRFRPRDELRVRLTNALGHTPAERTVFYCGSGVTAAHDVLAMVHAGLGEPRLYPGSWSEWITDPRRPVARGSELGG
jgi:thiosulfate/3-mercaptopyruvate sulfurtransferase